jgi:hypothetical protein
MGARGSFSAFFGLTLAAIALGSSSCAPNGFKDESQIETVRILASSADKPYAKPGDAVNLSILAFDGRPVQPEPMTLYWLPFVCENPIDDAYFACFEKLAAGGGGDAGAPSGAPGMGGGVPLKPGVDLTPLLPTGPTFSFQVPTDAISSHPAVMGAVPYGLMIVFNIACAGHLELIPLDRSNPQSPPIGCFDSSHKALGADDWVFGFTRVYAYADVTNTNPVIESVDVRGKRLAFAPFANTPGSGPSANTTSAPLVAPHCTSDCKAVSIGPVVPASSQEVQTQVGSGVTEKEQIWADFYSTLGSFDDEARLLYDVKSGSLGVPSVTNNSFHAPDKPGDGLVWIVVHDNRGGASWATVPVHVE